MSPPATAEGPEVCGANAGADHVDRPFDAALRRLEGLFLRRMEDLERKVDGRLLSLGRVLGRGEPARKPDDHRRLWPRSGLVSAAGGTRLRSASGRGERAPPVGP